MDKTKPMSEEEQKTNKLHAVKIIIKMMIIVCKVAVVAKSV